MQQTNQTSSWGAGDIAETITRLEQHWASAVKANDSGALAPLLSEIFIEMDSTGTIYRRSEALNRVAAGKWQIFEVTDIKVVVQANMAIATGAWHGKGKSPDGKEVDAREHWLDTWHKNGAWKCIASASAPLNSA